MASALVTFTEEKLKRLKVAYEGCTTESFWFEDNEYLKSYAKYMIEYLEGQFKGARK